MALIGPNRSPRLGWSGYRWDQPSKSGKPERTRLDPRPTNWWPPNKPPWADKCPSSAWGVPEISMQGWFHRCKHQNQTHPLTWEHHGCWANRWCRPHGLGPWLARCPEEGLQSGQTWVLRATPWVTEPRCSFWISPNDKRQFDEPILPRPQNSAPKRRWQALSQKQVFGVSKPSNQFVLGKPENDGVRVTRCLWRSQKYSHWAFAPCNGMNRWHWQRSGNFDTSRWSFF